MVTCRCGCQFENSRWDSHVRCPECGRIYANTAPDMFHPLSEDERRWKCSQCGGMNENSYQGGPSTKCAKCGANRPGDPAEWYGLSVPLASSRSAPDRKYRKRKKR